MTDMACGQAS